MMDLMDIQDISYIDIDELGVRPLNWIDDSNDIDLDETTSGYFGKEKRTQLQLINNGKKLTDDEGDALMPDDDDSNYEIDPETGEKIFCKVSIASSPSLSPTNDKWIEEYLSHIESSSTSAHQHLSLTISTNSELVFEDIPLSDDQTDSNWYSNYIPIDESPNNIMFPDQLLSTQVVTNNDKNFRQTTSPIFIPLTNTNNQDSLMNLLSVSIDDERSVGSSSNGSRHQRLFSSFETDSTTRDSEITFDGSYIEAKLEKIDHDDHSLSQMFLRRSSTRANYQGQQDAETLRRYNIPLTLYDITHSSTEEYNRHLGSLIHLNPEQVHIVKDIRRRGKNKIAAQNCRKRKAVSVDTLLEEVDELKRVKHDLEQRKQSYQQQITETRHQYEYLHRRVLPDRQLPPAIIVK